MKRFLPLLAAVVVVAAIALGLGLLRSGPRYNVVLISIDSLRQDRLGVYGHSPQFVPDLEVSPRIDALAAQGVLFEDAWSTTSWTLPAHMALMTGLHDGAHDVVADDFRLDPLRRTLAEEFRAGGYRTAGFYSGPYLDPKYGFGRGFDVYRSGMMGPGELAADILAEDERRAAAGLRRMNEGEQAAFRDRLSHRDVTSPRVNSGGLEFLEDRKDGEPFFLFLHYFDVHYDYAPPADLAQRFDPEYAGAMSGVDWYFNPAVRDPATGRRRISERDLDHVLALYDAEIHWVDRHVGAVLDRLRELGLEDSTIVCLTSDHGDEFFEHGSIGHRSTLHAEQLRVPLILRLPAGAHAGERVAAPVRIYDLAPTLLDLAGAGELSEATGESLRQAMEGGAAPAGGSLSRIVAGPQVADGWRDANFTVLRPFEVDMAAMQRERQLVVRQVRHSTAGVPLFRVYDRRENPGELGAPIAPSDPRYDAALAGFCRDFTRAQQRALGLPESPLRSRYAPEKSEEERATLAALGYASAGKEGSGPEQRFPPVKAFPPPCPPQRR